MVGVMSVISNFQRVVILLTAAVLMTIVPMMLVVAAVVVTLTVMSAANVKLAMVQIFFVLLTDVEDQEDLGDPMSQDVPSATA